MRARLTIALLAAAFTTPASAQVTVMPDASVLYPYTPERAVRENVTGRTTVRCQVQPDGTLNACALVAESPMGYAFGAASIKAAEQAVKAQPSQHGGQAFVDVRFAWNTRVR